LALFAVLRPYVQVFSVKRVELLLMAKGTGDRGPAELIEAPVIESRFVC
jgi:hypothetical protein